MAARGINKLTALQVKKAKASPDKMYKLPDGGNQFPQSKQGSRRFNIYADDD